MINTSRKRENELDQIDKLPVVVVTCPELTHIIEPDSIIWT